ncbi:hypothetical protein [Nostoc sp.]
MTSVGLPFWYCITLACADVGKTAIAKQRVRMNTPNDFAGYLNRFEAE